MNMTTLKEQMEDLNDIKLLHVIKDEKIIANYARDNMSDKQLFPVGCVFKTFLSILVGIAINERKISSIEDCVIDYVQHDDITDINWYKLKIKHVLSKTSGIVWPGPMSPIPSNINEVMQLKFECEPGAIFQYKPDPQIIVYLLEEVYHMDIVQLFQKKIMVHFSNLDYEWSKNDVQGMQLSINVLDELGQLFLNKGVIHGTRLFSEEYYEQCISCYSKGGFPECDAYGLGLWIKTDTDLPYFYSAGFGGQYMIVIPQKNIVISMISEMNRPHPENKQIIDRILQM